MFLYTSIGRVSQCFGGSRVPAAFCFCLLAPSIPTFWNGFTININIPAVAHLSIRTKAGMELSASLRKKKEMISLPEAEFTMDDSIQI